MRFNTEIICAIIRLRHHVHSMPDYDVIYLAPEADCAIRVWDDGYTVGSIDRPRSARIKPIPDFADPRVDIEQWVNSVVSEFIIALYAHREYKSRFGEYYDYH